MSNVSVFLHVCCSCPQLFTSGRLYTSFILNIGCDIKIDHFHGTWTINKMGSEAEKIIRAHFWLKCAISRAHLRTLNAI